MAHPEMSDADFKTAVMAHISLTEERARSPGIREGLKERPRLYYRNQPIILIEDLATGLNVNEKTIRRYRDSNRLEVFESMEGNIKFVLQSSLDAFIDSNFISSRHPDYPKLKKKNNNKPGNNAGQ